MATKTYLNCPHKMVLWQIRERARERDYFDTRFLKLFVGQLFSFQLEAFIMSK